MTSTGSYRRNTVSDKYRVLLELGEGGSAKVFLAVARGPSGFNKLVVLKALKRHLSDEVELRRSFLHEARLSARLNHPNVVSVNEVAEQDGMPTIVMEYLEGQALSAIVVRAGDDLTLPMHLRIISDSLSGLHYSHELVDYDGTPLNLVHRDFTPQNVFVTFDGVVKVLDFGIAKVQGAPGHTETGVIKGKLRYMPPEQILGDDLDRRADIYAVGAMLWEAAAGTRMWRDLGEATIMHRVINGDVPSPRSVNPDCPAEIERICMKALAPDREVRYGTALELQQDIEEFMRVLPSPVSNHELGQHVAVWFADVRAETRRTIERKLAEESTLTATSPDAMALSADHLARRRRRTVAVVAGLALLAAGIPIFLAYRQSQLPSEGTGSLGPEPSADASPVPSIIAVRVTIFPAEAHITLDGKPVGTNPYSDQARADGQWHVLRAEAAGFAPLERRIKFDHDVEMVLALQPLAPATPSATEPPKRPAVRPPPVPPRPVRPKPDARCSPPYYVDERGVKKYKPGCL